MTPTRVYAEPPILAAPKKTALERAKAAAAAAAA